MNDRGPAGRTPADPSDSINHDRRNGTVMTVIEGTALPETGDVTDPDELKRREYIAGLRMFADALEQNPELILPYSGRDTAGAICVIPLDEQRQQCAAWARAMPGRVSKTVHDDRAAVDIEGAFRGLHIKVIADRREVCERVVLGTTVVHDEVPDPTVTVPMVKVPRTVEQVEWRCAPILQDALAGGYR